jgi:co-chaperonin GroES (HSP10)
VKPNDITETDEDLKRAKKFGFHLPDNAEKERLQHGQIEGELIAVGGNCFEDWKDPIPKVGNTIVYDKYSGFIKDYKGVEYRIISDTDILAIL